MAGRGGGGDSLVFGCHSFFFSARGLCYHSCELSRLLFR